MPLGQVSQNKIFLYNTMPPITVFGRVTSHKSNCIETLKFFDTTPILACYETADDGCNRDHCHFIATTSDYKNLKSLRNSFATRNSKICGAHNLYSLKLYDPEKEAFAYICKGHKKDLTVKPDIFLNTYDIDPQQYYDIFHQNQAKHVTQNTHKNTWTSIVKFIDDSDPLLLHSRYTNKTPIKIASLMYDYYIANEKMVQGNFQQQLILRTIIAHSFKSKEIKKLIIKDWYEDFQYFSNGESHLNSTFELDDIL